MDYSKNEDLTTLPNEIWVSSHIGLNGYYEISNLGRIKRLNREKMQYGKPVLIKEKIMKVRKNVMGYYFLGLSVAKKIQKLKNVHRLVAESFLPNESNKKCVNHKNGIKTDNRVENLEWCTHLENSHHAHSNGLVHPQKGENHANAKLKNEQIIEIRQLAKSNIYYQGEIAEMYNVSRRTVGNILNNLIWKHV